MPARVVGAALIVAACSRPAPPGDGLAAGAVAVGTVSAGSPVVHALAAAGPVFLRATVEQLGDDLALELRDASGAVLATADAGGARWLPEVLTVLVDEPRGALSLAVTAGAAVAGSSDFELRVEELRPPRPEDGERLAVDRLLRAGQLTAAEPLAERMVASLRTFELAAERAAALADPRLEAEARQLQADVLLSMDRTAEGLAAARRALSRLAAVDEAPRLRATTLARLGWALSTSGEWEEAEHAFAEAAALTVLPLAASLEPELLRRRGEHAYRRGDREAAGVLFAAGLEACARAPCNPRERLWLLAGQGVVQRFLGRYAEALDLARQALEVADRLDDESNRALVLNNLGVVHGTRGEAAEALTCYRQAAELAPRVGRASLAATATGNMGQIFAYLGDLDRALEHGRRSLELHRELGSATGEALALMRLGWLSERRGELDEALALFDEALALSGRIGARSTEGLALVGRARTLTAAGRPGPALAALDRALPLLVEIGDVSGRIEALRARGEAQLELDDPAAAERSLREGLTLAVDLGDVGREAALRALLARAARARGGLEMARAQIERSLDLRESVRATLVSPALRASYQARGLDDYLEYVDLLLAGERTDDAVAQAFAAAERGKARMLVELLAEAQVDVARGVPEELLAERGAVVGELSAAQLELRRTMAADGGESAPAPRERIARLQGRLEELEWRIRSANPRYAELRYPEPIGPDETRALLGAETALLEFALGERRSHLFVVTPDRIVVRTLPARAALRPLLLALREGLESGGRRGRARLELSRSELYDTLLRPVEDLLEAFDRLVIVPDQELFYVPFESLVDARQGGREVVSRWAVTYAPSATALARLRLRERPDRRSAMQFVGFADPTPAAETTHAVPALAGPGAPWRSGRWPPLPASRRELDAIARLFPPDGRAVFQGAEATEAAVKSAPVVRAAERIHFAAHTVIDTRRPGYSALVLTAGSASEDGFLQVHEIFDLELAARLVVLSGCRTGLGKEVRGEGFVGMTQAFFYAGADALLVSLWPVPDDSTAELMVAVYEELRGGAGFGDAVRRAKLALIERHPDLHPYYWSAFVLVGLPA